MDSTGAQSITSLGYTYDVLEFAQPTGTAIQPTGTATPPIGTATQPTGTATPPTGAATQPTGTLLTPILPSLTREVAQPPAPITLGSATNKAVSNPFLETPIQVSTPNVIDALTRERAYSRFELGREIIDVEVGPNCYEAVGHQIDLGNF